MDQIDAPVVCAAALAIARVADHRRRIRVIAG